MAWYPSPLRGGKEGGGRGALEGGRGLEGTGTIEEGARWAPRVGGGGDWSAQRWGRNEDGTGLEGAGPRGQEGGSEGRGCGYRGAVQGRGL